MLIYKYFEEKHQPSKKLVFFIPYLHNYNCILLSANSILIEIVLRFYWLSGKLAYESMFVKKKGFRENWNMKVHSGPKCLPRMACLWSKMPMFQRAGMREEVEPLPLAFQYLILMIWRPCDINLVMISSLASKGQDFKLRGLQFHYIKWLKNGHHNFKGLQFWSRWRYDQI